MNPKEWLNNVPVEEADAKELEKETPSFIRATRTLDGAIRLVNLARRGESMSELCEKVVKEVSCLAVMSPAAGLPRQRAVTVPGKFVTMKAKYGDMCKLLSIDVLFTKASDDMNTLAGYLEKVRPWVEVRDQTKEVVVNLLLMLVALERKREMPPDVPKVDRESE